MLHLLPRLVPGPDLKKHTLSEWIELVDLFQVCISSVRKDPVNLLKVLRDGPEGSLEQFDPTCFLFIKLLV
jgi:hypothetical protein